MQGAGVAIRPHLADLVTCMLESLSSLEDPGLNYVEDSMMSTMHEDDSPDQTAVASIVEDVLGVCDNGEDRISAMPDDIMLEFLSPLTMKEAAKTSILSKRWRYLSAKLTHLDFNHSLVLPESYPEPESCWPTACEKTKYVNWVDQVVDLHRGPCIDTFRVCFHFDITAAHHVDKWVRFAASKKVKNLELQFMSDLNVPVYTIGYDTLSPSLNFLKSLHFDYLNISGDVVEFLLSQCCLLERLCITHSLTLVRLKVTRLASKLKHLAIRDCIHLEQLDLDAVNLTYFEYFAGRDVANFVFRSLPVLFEAAFGGGVIIDDFFPEMSFLAAHISKLSIDLSLNDNLPARVHPSFSNLKQLNVCVGDHQLLELFEMTRFLEVCPVLSEFKLKLAWDSPLTEAQVLQNLDLNVPALRRYVIEDEDVLVPKTHPNIKVLHVLGFGGGDDDVIFILHFLNFACNLETIICDLNICWFECPTCNVAEFKAVSTPRAKKLAQIIPPKISLVII